MIYHIRPSCLLCLNTVLIVCNIYLLSLTVKLPSISITHGEYETVIRHEVFEEKVDKGEVVCFCKCTRVVLFDNFARVMQWLCVVYVEK